MEMLSQTGLEAGCCGKESVHGCRGKAEERCDAGVSRETKKR